jgi:predicted ATP-dependent endonuclease of OLD family
VFENVRLVRKPRGSWQAKVSRVTHAEIAREVASAREEKPANEVAAQSKLYQELQPSLNEMFFSPVLILVEGIEDVAYVTAYLTLLGLTDEYRRLGCHMVPANGKSHMMQPRAIAKALAIPTFTVFDSDGHQKDKSGSREKHRKDNSALLRLCSAEKSEPFPAETYWGKNVVLWKSEMGEVVREEMGSQWEVLQEEARCRYGHVGGLEKNALFIGEVLSAAWERGAKADSLVRLSNELIGFARANGNR